MAFAFTICVLCAEEKVLFDASAKSELDGYDYISNFEITSDSGYFKKDSFEILAPNEKGIRFLARGVPKDCSTSYKIKVAYPSFLNEKDDGIGTGFIYNVKYIKSIKIEATTNLPWTIHLSLMSFVYSKILLVEVELHFHHKDDLVHLHKYIHHLKNKDD